MVKNADEIKIKYSPKEQAAFIHGWLYATAQEMKDQGEFEDFTVNEIIRLILKDIK